MDNVVFVPNEEELTEEVLPEPKPVEPVVQEQPTIMKKEYQKPTIMAHEIFDEDIEEEEYDDNDEFNSYNFEPEDDEPEAVHEQYDEPQEEKEEVFEEEYFVAESVVNDVETRQEIETEIILPNDEESPLEEVILEEKSETPLQNLKNESYDEEFEPMEIEEPIEAVCETKASEEKEYPEDSMDKMMEKLVQLETNHQIPSELIPTEYSSLRELPMPSNDPKDFMPLVPAGPLKDETYVSTADAVSLEQNPYFRSKKMNFHLKPIILTIVSIMIFIGVFISIFAILYAFK